MDAGANGDNDDNDKDNKDNKDNKDKDYKLQQYKPAQITYLPYDLNIFSSPFSYAI